MKKLPQDLSQLMHQSNNFPDIAEKATLLLYFDEHLKQIVAGSMAQQLKVANFRQGILIVETTSAAWAARINFQKHALLSQLQHDTSPILTAIEVKVNPRLSQRDTKSKISNKQIGAAAAEHINALAESVGGNLGEKLKRLSEGASKHKK